MSSKYLFKYTYLHYDISEKFSSKKKKKRERKKGKKFSSFFLKGKIFHHHRVKDIYQIDFLLMVIP